MVLNAKYAYKHLNSSRMIQTDLVYEYMICFGVFHTWLVLSTEQVTFQDDTELYPLLDTGWSKPSSSEVPQVFRT
jgi:hypothetical protein